MQSSAAQHIWSQERINAEKILQKQMDEKGMDKHNASNIIQ